MKIFQQFKVSLQFQSLILLLLTSTSAVSESIVITPQNLRDAVTSSTTPTEFLQQTVNAQIRDALESAGIGLEDGTLVYTDTLPALSLIHI